MILACSHLVIATHDVAKMVHFFSNLFGIQVHFENEMFAEFVLPSRHRIAFFKPVGASAKHFHAEGERGHCAFGVTVEDVSQIHETALRLNLKVSGPPKDHPWGEKSFLLTDPDGNRWEITQSPSPSGLLVTKGTAFLS